MSIAFCERLAKLSLNAEELNGEARGLKVIEHIAANDILRLFFVVTAPLIAELQVYSSARKPDS